MSAGDGSSLTAMGSSIEAVEESIEVEEVSASATEESDASSSRSSIDSNLQELYESFAYEDDASLSPAPAQETQPLCSTRTLSDVFIGQNTPVSGCSIDHVSEPFARFSICDLA